MTRPLYEAVAAFLIWGLLPLFLKQMPSLDAYEITAFRVIMSAISLSLFITYKFSFKIVITTFIGSLSRISFYLSTVLIGINWFLFVYCIEEGRILDASFGYFSGPLLSVALGFVFLKEKVTSIKLLAILFVIVSVFIQALEVGEIPIISVVLALSFALYGLIKKVTYPDPLHSLFFESAMIAPAAIVYLLFFSQKSYLLDVSHSEFWFIASSGIVTIVPLVLFTKAAKELALSTLGFIQYISPLTQFVIGSLIYQEQLSTNKIFSFILIWVSCMMILISQNQKKQGISK